MIAVSGGGIAVGLAAGIAILRNQIPLLLVAGSALPATAMLGGVQIAPNGWNALDHLGVGELVRAKATNLDAINVRDMRSGATLASLDLRQSAYASIARASLTQLLEAEIKKKIAEPGALRPISRTLFNSGLTTTGICIL